MNGHLPLVGVGVDAIVDGSLHNNDVNHKMHPMRHRLNLMRIETKHSRNMPDIPICGRSHVVSVVEVHRQLSLSI